MSHPPRHDHTKPTVAFIGLAVAAAAVMTAGMTDRGRDVVAAADVPTTSASPVVVARPERAPRPLPPPQFSIAELVTLDGAPEEKEPRRDRRRPAREPAPPPVSDAPAAATSGGSGGGGSVGSGSPAPGSRTSGGGSGSSGGGGGGGGGGGSSTAGPGRSETGKGEARGQRDRKPGKGKAVSTRRSGSAHRR